MTACESRRLGVHSGWCDSLAAMGLGSFGCDHGRNARRAIGTVGNSRHATAGADSLRAPYAVRSPAVPSSVTPAPTQIPGRGRIVFVGLDQGGIGVVRGDGATEAVYGRFGDAIWDPANPDRILVTGASDHGILELTPPVPRISEQLVRRDPAELHDAGHEPARSRSARFTSSRAGARPKKSETLKSEAKPGHGRIWGASTRSPKTVHGDPPPPLPPLAPDGQPA